MAGERRGVAWTVLQWMLTVVIGVGGVVMCAGPRAAVREAKR